ncbi:MAG: hypothetical protein AAGD07_12715 [Planctomycetota bacterium]
MIADQQSRLDKLLEETLEPDEEIIGTAFGLRCFSRIAERRLKLFGFYFGGAWLNLILADRVYFAMTTNRLILLELTPRYLRYEAKSEVNASRVVVQEANSAGMYTLLDFVHLPEDLPAEEFRIRFPRMHTSFRENGKRADRLIAHLRDESEESVCDAMRAVVSLVQESRDVQDKKTTSVMLAWVTGIAMSVVGGLILMLVSAMATSLYIDDLDSAEGLPLAVALLTTFLLAPLAAIASSVFIVRRVFFADR